MIILKPRFISRMLRLIAATGLLAIFSFTLYAYGQDQSAKSPKMNMATMDAQEPEVAHPFFTHMGMPDAVGIYSLRLGGLVTRAEDKTDADLAFHLETGLTDFIGVHLRNDGIRDRQHSEIMFQFAAIRSDDRMSGFSPLIEFEFATHSGGDQHVNTMVGFTTAIANPKYALNQVLHYDPRSDGVEGSAAFVVALSTQLYPVVELAGEGMPGEQPILNVLGGMKVRVNDGLLLGIALQAPITTRKDFSWQLVFQPEIEWGKMK